MSTNERTYLVPGMTCDHCRHAITTAVSAVPGVAAVDVRLEDKEVVVTGGTGDAVRQAIDDTGYEVTGTH